MTRRARLLAACFTLLLASSPVSAFERPEIRFDSRTWKVGHQASSKNQIMVEFVLDSETVENWTELVTTQLISGLDTKTTIADYIAGTKQSIENRCPSLKWNTIRTRETDAIYEWSVSSCKGVPDQSEIARVFKGVEGIHIVHYAVRKSAMSPLKREEWIGLLEKARLLS